MRREVLIENSPDDPTIIIEPILEPGYHNDKDWVNKSYLWLERWGILPKAGGLLDQDRTWVADIEMRAALKSEMQREYWIEKKSKDDGPGQLPEGWS